VTQLDPELRACAVCARILDQSRDGKYGHVIVPESDHIAVPVLPQEIRADWRCDFCSMPRPSWLVPVADFRTPNGETGSKGPWSACELCALLIRHDDWQGLLRHVIANKTMWTGEVLPVESRPYLAALYRRVAASQLGPPEPWTPPATNPSV
jgi:hypothetical protein